MIEFQKLIDFTGKEEGLRLQTYKCPAGYDTIGYGHNLEANGLPEEILEDLKAEGIVYDPNNRNDLAITHGIADRLFGIDALNAESSLRQIFPSFGLFSENRQIALIDMMFNLGTGRFRGFKKMINAIKLGKWHMAAMEAEDSLWYRKLTFEYKSKRAERVIKKLKEE